MPSGVTIDDLIPVHPQCRCITLPVPVDEGATTPPPPPTPTPTPPPEPQPLPPDFVEEWSFSDYDYLNSMFKREMDMLSPRAKSQLTDYINTTNDMFIIVNRVRRGLEVTEQHLIQALGEDLATGLIARGKEMFGSFDEFVRKRFMFEDLASSFNILPGVDRDLVGYRGIRLTDEFKKFLRGRRAGDVFTDDGFFSTSLDYDTAAAFGDDFVMKVKIPKGTKVMSVISEDELEMMLRPGTSFRIQEIGDRYMVIEVVEPRPLPPPSRLFTPISGVEELDRHPLRNFGVGNLWVEGSHKMAINQVNRIGGHMDEVFSFRPGLANFVEQRTEGRIAVYLDLKDAQAVGGRGAAVARYDKELRVIEFPARRVRKSNLSLSSPSDQVFNVGKGTVDTFRHEYGHAVYHTLMENKERDAWFNLWEELGRTYFEKKVSWYAGADVSEAFAECFSAWTHPEYGSSPSKTLPKRVEEFFERMFGIAAKEAEEVDEVVNMIRPEFRQTYLEYKRQFKERLLDEIGEEDLRFFHDRWRDFDQEVLDRLYEIDIREKLLDIVDFPDSPFSQYVDYCADWQEGPDHVRPVWMKLIATEVESGTAFRIPDEVSASAFAPAKKIPSEARTSVKAFRAWLDKEFGASTLTHDHYLRMRAFNQAYMEVLGIEEVELYRGMRGGPGQEVAEVLRRIANGEEKVTLSPYLRDNCLTGYSPSKEIADGFGADVGGVTVRIRAPRSQVMIHEDLLAGLTEECIEEREYILAGGNVEVDIGSIRPQGDGIYVEKTKRVRRKVVGKRPRKPTEKPMPSAKPLEACVVDIISGSPLSYSALSVHDRPESCKDIYKTEEGWFHKGKPVTDEATLKRLKELRIPPAWTDVVVAVDPDAKIQAIGRDAAGRWQYRYSAKHMEEAARKKFERIKSFHHDIDTIRRKIDEGVRHSDPRALLLRLEDKTAIRAGSLRDFRAKKKAYGLTTLQHEHVELEGDTIRLRFTAKEGIEVEYTIVDGDLAAWLRERKAATRPGERLFPDIDAKKLNRYLKELAGGKKYSLKDFRTFHGTRIAYEELKRYTGKRLTTKEKKKVVKEVLKKVSDFLKNTPTIAKQAYIDPMVWELIGGLP